MIATKVDQTYVDDANAAQDILIAGKVDQTYVDNANTTQNTVIAQNKADQDAKNTAQDALIATKVDQVYVDSKNSAQDAVIVQNKVEQDAKNKTQDSELLRLEKVKADKTYVDEKNATQDNIIAQNQADQTAKNSAQDLELIRLEEVKADKSYVDEIKELQIDRSELIALGDHVLKSANEYTDQRINKLEATFRAEDDELRAGIAGAMALTGLPQAVDYGRGMLSIAGASYKGETALAVGGSAVFENGVTLKLGATTDSKSNTGATIGLGYHF